MLATGFFFLPLKVLNSAKNVVVHPCNPSIQELEHEVMSARSAWAACANLSQIFISVVEDLRLLLFDH